MIRATTPQPPTTVARHYDELDPFYRELWGDHLHHGYWRTGVESADEAVVALVEEVAERAAIRSGFQVCDVGCGYGATARLLAGRFGASVTGITVSRVQLDHARARSGCTGSSTFLLADWIENRLPDRAFDAVIAIESTEHMTDKRQCFAEIARVLRPGGRAVICAWLAAEHIRAWHERWLLQPICVEGRLPSLGTLADYRAWIEDAQLVLESAEDLTQHVRQTWTICAGRLARRLLTDRSAWHFLLDGHNSERGFARAVLRIAAAYATGCLRYGVLVARRPLPV